MTTPERTTAAAFPRYLTGEVVADSVALQWSGLYARRWRLPRVVDRLLVPATPEPHISCNLRGMAEFQERDDGGAWITRRIGEGDLFVTRSRTPYEVRFEPAPGQQLASHFAHVFKETAGMTPLQLITRQRITRAQQLIRETSRSLIDVGLEVGYSSPSHFAQVFRRVVGVTPTEFRSSL